jgi:hypothetical protein
MEYEYTVRVYDPIPQSERVILSLRRISLPKCKDSTIEFWDFHECEWKPLVNPTEPVAPSRYCQIPEEAYPAFHKAIMEKK